MTFGSASAKPVLSHQILGGVAHWVWVIAPLDQALQVAAVFAFALSFLNELSERVALADPYLDVWTELIVARVQFPALIFGA